jgi:hypothetical protein
MAEFGDRYAAIWQQVPYVVPAWQAYHQMSESQLKAKSDELGQQGYRLRQFSVACASSSYFYAGIWEKVAGPPWQWFFGLTGQQYQAKFDELNTQGYRLVYVTGYNDRLAGIWEKIPGPPWQASHNLTPAQYQQKFQELGSQGYRLTLINGYNPGPEERYAAIWQKLDGDAWQAFHGLTGDQLDSKFLTLQSQGYVPTHLSGYANADNERYAVIFERTIKIEPGFPWTSSGGTWLAKKGMISQQYQQEFQNWGAQQFRLRSISAYYYGRTSTTPAPSGNEGGSMGGGSGGSGGGSSAATLYLSLSAMQTGDAVLAVVLSGGGFSANETVTIEDSFSGVGGVPVVNRTDVQAGPGGMFVKNDYGIFKSPLRNVAHSIVAVGNSSGKRSNTVGTTT